MIWCSINVDKTPGTHTYKIPNFLKMELALVHYQFRRQPISVDISAHLHPLTIYTASVDHSHCDPSNPDMLSTRG